MTDLPAAIAAAREALEYYYASEQDGVSPDALRNLLAALAAAKGEAVAWKITLADNTGTYDYAQWAGLQAPQAPPAADYVGDAGPATDDDFVDLPAAVPAGYDEDEIADACIMAEVSDSKYEAIITYLSDNRRAMLAAANKEGAS